MTFRRSNLVVALANGTCLILMGCSGSVSQTDSVAADIRQRCHQMGYDDAEPDDDNDGDEVARGWKCVHHDGGTTMTGDMATPPPPTTSPDMATPPPPTTTDMAMPPTADTTPPTFAGATSATANSASAITVAWSAGSDNVTPSSQLVYLIYRASSSGGESYATPSYTTAAGATSFQVTGLSASTTYYFVVRARDAAGNIDTNTKQVSATTSAPAVSFANQVQPIFTNNCAGCHGGGTFPTLTAGSSYGQLVNVASQRCNAAKEVVPGQPAQSYLLTALTSGASLGTCSGGFMSNYVQSADLNTITAWIAEGAPNN